MGAVLGEVATSQLTEAGALVSAIVVYLGQNDAGPGFFKLASALSLLAPKSSAEQKLVFWADQVKRIHEHYA